MTCAPTEVPAAPMPVIARPIMRAMEEGAAAQTMEPISNKATIVTRVHFAEWYLYPESSVSLGLFVWSVWTILTKTLPMGNCEMHKVNKNAASYQEMSPKL